MKKGNVSFDKIYDLFAVRVVLDVPLEREKSDCWEVYSIVTDHYRPNPSRLKDWVSTPKSNGYESLHTTVMSMPFGNDKEGRVLVPAKDRIDFAESHYATAREKLQDIGTCMCVVMIATCPSLHPFS